MKINHKTPDWIPYLIISLAVTTLPLAVSLYTGLWVFSAISIGFLFGFFLQKGQLCGSSAFSEVIVIRDSQKLWGLWIAIITGMAVFAMASAAGWVTLPPKPMMWGSYVVGGIIFGAGTVLAGGCISGCLYKASEGNLNSMVALLGIALGVSMVEYGPLQGFSSFLKKATLIKNTSGGPVTLSSLTGLTYSILTLIFITATLLSCYIFSRQRAKRMRSSEIIRNPDASTGIMRKIIARRWRPWQAGLAIGILGLLAWLSSVQTGRNYPLGVTHGVLFVHTLVTAQDHQGIYKAPVIKNDSTVQVKPESTAPAPKRKVGWWLVLLVTSLMLGSWVSAKAAGDVRFLPKPPEQVVTAIFGGLMVGIGAAFAGGCVVGNIMSGWALMSVGCILFGVCTLLSNWTMAWFYLLGGWD